MSPSEPLAEFLHEKLPDLNAFADRIRQFIIDYISTDPRYGPYYVVKSRVKSYASLEKNLLKAAERGDDIGKAAQDMLADENRSLQHLMLIADDLVGVRIVFHFRADVERLFEDMKDGKLRWFAPKLNPDGTIRHKAFRFDQNAQKSYTSLHVSGGIAPHYFIREDFVGLTAEVQIRTLLEEAWGEPNHYLVYKTPVYSQAAADASMKNMKGILTQLDNELDNLHKEFRDRSQQFFNAEHLQVVGTYRIEHPAKTPSSFEKLHRAAYSARRQGNQQNATKYFLELKGDHLEAVDSHAVDELTGRGLRDELEDRLSCDIAHQCLLRGTRLDLVDAEKLYRKVIDRNPEHFWAHFRLAYVYQNEDLDKAIALTEQALLILEQWSNRAKNREDCPIPWWRGAGLSADIRSYLATLYWRRAEKCFIKRVEEAPMPWPMACSTEGANYGEKALAVAKHALQESQHIPKDGKYSNYDKVRMRALNAVCYYSVQMGYLDDISSSIKELRSFANHMPHPLVLDTLGWYEFKRIGGDVSQAIDLITRAKQVAEAQVLPKGARRTPGGNYGVSLHYDIIEECIRTGAPYQPGEEYWNWHSPSF